MEISLIRIKIRTDNIISPPINDANYCYKRDYCVIPGGGRPASTLKTNAHFIRIHISITSLLAQASLVRSAINEKPRYLCIRVLSVDAEEEGLLCDPGGECQHQYSKSILISFEFIFHFRSHSRSSKLGSMRPKIKTRILRVSGFCKY